MTQKAVRFFRVSGKKQEDGYSLEAQEKESLHYEGRHSLEAVRTWAVAESAKTSEVRKAFHEMVEFLRKNPSVTAMLFEKPDRMTRNFRDLVTIYELIEKHGKELHFFKTGLKINRESKSTDQLQLDIQVVLARQFINNLREEVMKGMLQKVKNGGWPGVAPPGYLNHAEEATIKPDPEQAPLVKRSFELYATGRYTLRELEKMAAELGLRSRQSGQPLAQSTLYAMLRNPLYYGLVRWGGIEGMGKHEPLVTKALFDRVQEVLGCESRPKTLKFAFRGMAICGGCGSAVTAERHTKKQKNGNRHEYVYYHCTGWKNGRTVCKDAYMREEDLIEQLAQPLKAIAIDDQVIAVVKKALKESFTAEKDFARDRSTILQAEEKRLKNRLDQAYADKLDGMLPADEYREKAENWRSRLFQIREEVRQLEDAHDMYLEEAGRILDLAQRAYEVYRAQKDNWERRKMIDLMVSRVVISGKKAVSNLREPFQTLSKLAAAAKSGSDRSGWYARQDLNL